MGKKILKTEEIAFNLLAEHTCNNCKGCVHQWTMDTCNNWEEKFEINEQTINDLKSTVNNAFKSSIVLSEESIERIKYELNHVLKRDYPNSDSRIEVTPDLKISITTKFPVYSEYIECQFEAKY